MPKVWRDWRKTVSVFPVRGVPKRTFAEGSSAHGSIPKPIQGIRGKEMLGGEQAVHILLSLLTILFTVKAFKERKQSYLPGIQRASKHTRKTIFIENLFIASVCLTCLVLLLLK